MNAIARSIVRCYPRAWRERYEDEVLELIDAGPIRLGDVCGLLRHCISERVLALYEPSRHITAYRFISGLALLVYFTVLTVAACAAGALPFLLGAVLRVTLGPFPEQYTDAVGWILLPVFALAVVLHMRQLFRFRHSETTPSPAIGRAAWIMLVSYGALVFTIGLSEEFSFRLALHHGLFTWLVLQADRLPPAAAQWPGGNLFETLGRLRSARNDLRWARMELDRCEGLYAGRDPGPDLRAARAELSRLTTEEANAMAELDAMGYHARFQH
jgi:hypothetical protein